MGEKFGLSELDRNRISKNSDKTDPIMQLHKEAFQCGTKLYVNIFYCSLRYTVSLSFHFKILDSISSKLKPFVSGTVRTMNKTAKNAIAAKRRKMFSAPRNSCRIEPANQIEE